MEDTDAPKCTLCNQQLTVKHFLIEYCWLLRMELEVFLPVRKAYEDCLLSVLHVPYPNDGEIYCGANFDLACWNYTLAGNRAYIPCPSHIPGFNKQAFAFKDCSVNGTWQPENPNNTNGWANYSACKTLHTNVSNYLFVWVFIGGYTTSIILLALSLLIFSKFRQLRCDRVTIHKNLFASYIINGLVWISHYASNAIAGSIMLLNPIICKSLHILAQYTLLSNFSWMLCEGVYLYTMIVRTFVSGRNTVRLCYVIGWALPIFPVTVYSLCRSYIPQLNENCWISWSWVIWIIDGPVILFLLVNVWFLANILHVLVTKIRATTDSSQTKKAVRATLVLVPLLGLQYLMMHVSPAEGSKWSEAYTYLTAIFVSLQGSFLAILYCFCNGEVKAIFVRKWRQRQQLSETCTKRRASTVHTLYTTSDANGVLPTHNKDVISLQKIEANSSLNENHEAKTGSH